MVGGGDDKKEDEFDFTDAGEALGYISLEQARVLAIEYSRDHADFYGPSYVGVRLAWEVISAEEGEDYYDIRLSFRPSGRYRGEPGEDQLIFEKTGELRVRQILDEPSELGQPARRGLPVVLLALAGVVLVAVVAGGVVFAAGGFSGGEGEEPGALSALPAGTAPASTPQSPAIASADTQLPVDTAVAGAAVNPTVQPTPTATQVAAPALLFPVLRKWGSKGPGDGQFEFPSGIAVEVPETSTSPTGVMTASRCLIATAGSYASGAPRAPVTASFSAHGV